MRKWHVHNGRLEAPKRSLQEHCKELWKDSCRYITKNVIKIFAKNVDKVDHYFERLIYHFTTSQVLKNIFQTSATLSETTQKDFLIKYILQLPLCRKWLYLWISKKIYHCLWNGSKWFMSTFRILLEESFIWRKLQFLS